MVYVYLWSYPGSPTTIFHSKRNHHVLNGGNDFQGYVSCPMVKVMSFAWVYLWCVCVVWLQYLQGYHLDLSLALTTKSGRNTYEKRDANQLQQLLSFVVVVVVVVVVFPATKPGTVFVQCLLTSRQRVIPQSNEHGVMADFLRDSEDRTARLKWSVKYLEDHPSGCKCLVTMISKSSKDRVTGLWDPFQMAYCKWFINGWS